MTDDKCICDEINFRHCPVHQEPAQSGSFSSESAPNEPNLTERAAREWWLLLPEPGQEGYFLSDTQYFERMIKVVEAERLEQAERELALALERIQQLQITCGDLTDRLDKVKDALQSITAKSHSWVIVEATAYIEKPIHDSYRSIAERALRDIK